MSLKKVTLASLILLSLTACSGGGGGSAPVAKNDKKPAVQQPAKPANKTQNDAKKAEADRLAKQKAEEERLKKEEADRLAKQKAEEERLKKEEADRLAKQKAEEERLKKEEADRIAKENKAKLDDLKLRALKTGYTEKEAEEFAKNNLNKDPNVYLSNLGLTRYDKAYNMAIETGLSNEEAYQLAVEYSEVDADIRNLKPVLDARKAEMARIKQEQEKAEAERLKKAEEERIAREKRIRENTEKYKQVAIESGLTDEDATEFASKLALNDVVVTSEEFPEKIKEFKAEKLIREIDTAKGIISANYNAGLNKIGHSASSSASSSCVNFRCTTWEGTNYSGTALYNQSYSVVTGDYSGEIGTRNGIRVNTNNFNPDIRGLHTVVDNIPTMGTATYTGKAFNGVELGDLNYSVNFDNRTGSGTVNGLDSFRYVYLTETQIDGNRLNGSVEGSNYGSYSLEFFGPKAEEISGKMEVDTKNYGLAGTRGEISK